MEKKRTEKKRRSIKIHAMQRKEGKQKDRKRN